MTATTLYRHWSVNDELLYVGIAYCEKERRKQHRREAVWWPMVHRVSTEHYATRRAAEDAETRAINVEQPLFNVASVVNRQQAQRAMQLRSAFMRGATYNERSAEPFTVSSLFTLQWSESLSAARQATTCADCEAVPMWTARRRAEPQWMGHEYVALCAHHAVDEWVYAPPAAERLALVHYAADMWLRVVPGLQYVSRLAADQ